MSLIVQLSVLVIHITSEVSCLQRLVCTTIPYRLLWVVIQSLAYICLTYVHRMTQFAKAIAMNGVASSIKTQVFTMIH